MADHYVKQFDTAIPLKIWVETTDPITGDLTTLDLTGYSVVVNMILEGETTPLKITDGVCVNDPDQVANKGLTVYSWADADVATVAGATSDIYDLEVKVTSTTTSKSFRIPRMAKKRNFKKVEMLRALNN